MVGTVAAVGLGALGVLRRSIRGARSTGAVAAHVVRRYAGAAMLLLTVTACIPDDWDGQPYRGWDDIGAPTDETGAPIVTGDGLPGSWVSEGADLSDLLAGEPFNYVRVDATFDDAGGYSVVGEDANGDVWPLIGTWEAVEGAPGTITLVQVEPSEAIAEGLWQIDGDALTWETVQTTPDYGFQPPTPGSGFGSSTGPGLAPGVNVQTFRRTE